MERKEGGSGEGEEDRRKEMIRKNDCCRQQMIVYLSIIGNYWYGTVN